jgi:hypothetical protein
MAMHEMEYGDSTMSMAHATGGQQDAVNWMQIPRWWSPPYNCRFDWTANDSYGTP